MHNATQKDYACVPEKPGRPSACMRTEVCFISPLGYGLYNRDCTRTFGGAEVQFYLLARELSRDPNFQVRVLTTAEGEAGIERHDAIVVHKRRAKGRAGSRSGGWVRWSGYVAAFRDMYRQLASIDADVYVHAGAGIEVGAYALICRLLARRFVYVVVSSVDVAAPYGGVRGPLRWLFPFGLKYASAIVCQTAEQIEWLRERYGRTGILIRAGHPILDEPSAERTDILWAGRIDPVKQPLLFLTLAERIPSEHFVMAVLPHDHYRDLWGEVMARASHLPNVKVRVGVARDEIGSCFSRAKVFVNTSQYEGFPNTFVEAALQSTPVVSWAVDPDRVLVTRHIGLCAHGSLDRLIDTVSSLALNADRRAEMGKRARSYAAEHHNLARVVEEYKHLVAGLMESARSREVA